MITALVDHLWQSTAFAALVGLLTMACRTNRAATRYALWFTASVKFLVPLSLFSALVAFLPPLSPLQQTSLPAVAQTIRHLAQPAGIALDSAAAQSPIDQWLPVLAVAWGFGCAVVMARRVRGWRAVRTAVRSARPLAMSHAGRTALDVRLSSASFEPGVVGIARPVVLMPSGLEKRLTPAQRAAVLAHEECHVRRRDNLTAAVHMLVEAIFWFHPVVWWIGARLLAERERACDEHVLQTRHQPRTYAEAILTVCRFYIESPIACVSGVGGSQLALRVERILLNQTGVQMNTARKSALVITLLLSCLVSVIAGGATNPIEQARSGGPGRPVPSPGTPQEVALRRALFDMRDAIDQYKHDRNQYPRTIAVLVREGYLKMMPVDPFTHSDSTWKAVRDPKQPRILVVFDVKSGSTGTATDGSKYSSW